MTTSNIMTVTVPIDQNAAIKRGFAADSTAKISIDLAGLTQVERDYLAECFDRGNINLKYYPHCPEPTEAGLLEIIRVHLAKRAQNAVDVIEKHAKISAQIEAGDEGISLFSIDTNKLSETAQKILIERALATEKKNAEDREKRNADIAEQAAKEAAQEAVLRVQREAFLLTATAIQQDRRKCGLMTDQELDDLIRAAELSNRGLSFNGDFGRTESDRLQNCTDEQFANVQTFRAKLPEGVEVEIFELYDMDEYGDKENQIVVVEASWMVGKIKCRADQEI